MPHDYRNLGSQKGDINSSKKKFDAFRRFWENLPAASTQSVIIADYPLTEYSDLAETEAA